MIKGLKFMYGKVACGGLLSATVNREWPELEEAR